MQSLYEENSEMLLSNKKERLQLKRYSLILSKTTSKKVSVLSKLYVSKGMNSQLKKYTSTIYIFWLAEVIIQVDFKVHMVK